MRLHTADGAQNQDAAVQNAQRAFDLDGEIDVAGGIDDIDFMILPFAVGGCRGDRNAAFFLQFHGVHRRPDAVFAFDVVDRVDTLGIKQDPFGKCGFAGINMGTDADIPDLLNVLLHFLTSTDVDSNGED